MLFRIDAHRLSSTFFTEPLILKRPSAAHDKEVASMLNLICGSFAILARRDSRPTKAEPSGARVLRGGLLPFFRRMP